MDRPANLMEPVKRQTKQPVSMRVALRSLTVILIGWALCVVDVNIANSSIFKFAFGWNLDFVSDVLGFGLIAYGIWPLLKYQISDHFQLLLKIAMVVAICNGGIQVAERVLPSNVLFKLPGLMLSIVSVAGMVAFVTAMMEFSKHFGLKESYQGWKKSQVLAAWWGAALGFKVMFKVLGLMQISSLAFNTKQLLLWMSGIQGPVNAAAAILGLVLFIFATISVFKMHKEIENLGQLTPVPPRKFQPETKSPS